MPELPEVEHARAALTRWLRGATIARAGICATRVVRGAAPAAMARALAGRRVTSVERRGKQLRLALDDGARLFSHLGMSGKWVLRAADTPPERWERARLEVRGPRGRTRAVIYVDPRMLGGLTLVPRGEEDPRAYRALGPDPLLDGVDLARVLAARTTIKEALMDQRRLAGVGNIQATEALFRARVHPARPAASIAPAEARTLARAVLATLKATLAAQAADPDRIVYVEDAGAPNPFAVYGRAGEPCPRCGASLVRVVLGGRGTTFCPACQPARAAPALKRRGRARSR